MNSINPEIRKGLSVVSITQDECRVWSDGLAPNTEPLRIHPKVFPGKKKFQNVREGQNHRGHDVDMFGEEYLESISLMLAGAQEILLVTHGTGKSSAFGAFKEHIDSQHSDLAKRVIGHIKADLTNLTDPQLLALVRDWYQTSYPSLG